MFKELKVIKLIVFAGLLVAILLKLDFKDLSIDHLYFDKTEYKPGENVKVWSSTKAPGLEESKVYMSGIGDEELLAVDLKLERKNQVAQDVLANGLSISRNSNFVLPKTMNPGIYKLAGQYPLVVNGKWNADITWVYPAMNNLIYERIDEKDVFTAGTNKTSLKRGVVMDEFSQGLLAELPDLSLGGSVNYMTDYQLEQKEFFASKVLVIYGKATFWTPIMRKNIETYIAQGGNVLFMTTYALNNVCWIEKTNNEIILYDSSRSDAIQSWLGYSNQPPRDLIGGSHLFGGESNQEDYIINDHTHPLFEKVDELKLNAELYSAPPVTWTAEKPQFDTAFNKFHKSRLLAYNSASTGNGTKTVKAIYELQLDSASGKIIHLGAEDWCTALPNNKNAKQLTLNAINYLIKH